MSFEEEREPLLDQLLGTRFCDSQKFPSDETRNFKASQTTSHKLDPTAYFRLFFVAPPVWGVDSHSPTVWQAVNNNSGMKGKCMKLIVIEVSGGVVQDVYTDEDIPIILVDWDEDETPSRSRAGVFAAWPLDSIPADTREQLLKMK